MHQMIPSVPFIRTSDCLKTKAKLFPH